MAGSGSRSRSASSARSASRARSTPRPSRAAQAPPAPDVEAVRRFNRFYTRQIGVLQERLLDSPFSLTDVRVLWEIAHRDRPTATELAKALDLDNGYLSRILQRFTRRRLITRTASKLDARQTHLALTAHGRDTFEPLQQVARDEIATLLERLTTADRARVIEAMHTIESCLAVDGADADSAGEIRASESAAQRAHASTTSATTSGAAPARTDAFTLRTHRPGDLGWIVHRHGALYAQEYAWNSDFEALVAEIAAHFLRDFDPARERCWVAVRPGPFPTGARTQAATPPDAVPPADGVSHIAGSIMLVKQSDEVAKLRLLLVEPSARGLGIGKRLVEECIRFAREAGYRTITLWTQSNLAAARGIYKAAGFRLVASVPNPAFGHDDLVAETWELTL